MNQTNQAQSAGTYQGHGKDGGVCLHSKGELYPFIVFAQELPDCQERALRLQINGAATYMYRVMFGDTVSPYAGYETIKAVAEVAKDLSGHPAGIGYAQALRLAIQDAQEANLFTAGV